MKSFCNTIQHSTKYHKTYEEQKKCDDNQEKKKTVKTDLEKNQILELVYKEFKIITNNKLRKTLKYKLFQQTIL